MSAPTVAALVGAKYIEAAQTTQYTATALTAIVDLMTVTNVTASSATFSAHIVTSGGSASAANKVISSREVLPGESFIAYEMGHTLEAGAFISTSCSAGSALVIYVSGREVPTA